MLYRVTDKVNGHVLVNRGLVAPIDIRDDYDELLQDSFTSDESGLYYIEFVTYYEPDIGSYTEVDTKKVLTLDEVKERLLWN